MICRSLSEIPPDFGPCAVTIGNFDGVHAGHRELMRRVVSIAQSNAWRSVVLTFDPHPARVLAPHRAPRMLTSLPERCALISALGIDRIVILPFTLELAALTAEQFAEQVLADAVQARAVLVGQDFRFGKGAAGSPALLAEFGRRLGFTVEVASVVKVRGRAVSSSAIRGLVESGQVSLACRLLERPFALEGQVVAGQGIGSRSTVPTLNLDSRSEVIPANGVYITQTQDLGSERRWDSVTNVGFRPTFDGKSLTIETFLLSPPFEGETPREIRVEFRRRLRDERKFEDAAALKAQIGRDVSRTFSWFRRLRREKLSTTR